MSGLPLLEERLGIHLVLADRARLPSPERAGRVDLVERVPLGLVVAGDEQRDTVRSDSAVKGESHVVSTLTSKRTRLEFHLRGRAPAPRLCARAVLWKHSLQFKTRSKHPRRGYRHTHHPEKTAEPSDSPRLRRLLHHGRDLANEDACGRVLAVDLPVRLSTLAGLGDEDAEVGPHARVDEADVGADDRDLLEDRVVDERRGRLLGRCDDDSVRGCRERGTSAVCAVDARPALVGYGSSFAAGTACKQAFPSYLSGTSTETAPVQLGARQPARPTRVLPAPAELPSARGRAQAHL